MTATIHFTVPGRASPWQRAAQRRGQKQKFQPKGQAAAQKAIGTYARIAMGGIQPLTGPLRLEVLVVYAIPPSWPEAKQQAARDGKVWKTARPDWDNIGKQISDALNGVAYADDAQIVRADIGKRYGSPERTEVRITQLDVMCDHSPASAFREAKAARIGQGTMLPQLEKARNTESAGQGRG